MLRALGHGMIMAAAGILRADLKNLSRALTYQALVNPNK
jgi:hypothetical protein